MTCGEYDYNMQNYLWRKRVKLVANTGYCRGHIDTDNEYMYYYSVEFIK